MFMYVFHILIIHFAQFSDKNPEKPFLNSENRKLMKRVTRMNLDKIYQAAPTPRNAVRLEFLTQKQVEERQKQAYGKAKNRLQMPPILKVRHKQTAN